MKHRKPLILMVPKAGLEPARPQRRGILNPLRLPFRHLGHGFDLAKDLGKVQPQNAIFLALREIA